MKKYTWYVFTIQDNEGKFYSFCERIRNNNNLVDYAKQAYTMNACDSKKEDQTMGTINYGTSKYITMGAREYSYYDFEHDSCFMEEARAQSEEYGDDIEDIIYAEIASCYECDRDNVEWYLENKYGFDHYSIKIEPGYYEGFYLNILHDPGYYDDEDERKEVYKEIDQVKDFLIDIAGCGIACVYPGWSTKYLDYDGTVAAINQAVEKMRKEAEAMPTYDEYVRREYGIETEKAADTAAA